MQGRKRRGLPLRPRLRRLLPQRRFRLVRGWRGDTARIRRLRHVGGPQLGLRQHACRPGRLPADPRCRRLLRCGAVARHARPDRRHTHHADRHGRWPGRRRRGERRNASVFDPSLAFARCRNRERIRHAPHAALRQDIAPVRDERQRRRRRPHPFPWRFARLRFLLRNTALLRKRRQVDSRRNGLVPDSLRTAWTSAHELAHG